MSASSLLSNVEDKREISIMNPAKPTWSSRPPWRDVTIGQNLPGSRLIFEGVPENTWELQSKENSRLTISANGPCWQHFPKVNLRYDHCSGDSFRSERGRNSGLSILKYRSRIPARQRSGLRKHCTEHFRIDLRGRVLQIESGVAFRDIHSEIRFPAFWSVC